MPPSCFQTQVSGHSMGLGMRLGQLCAAQKAKLVVSQSSHSKHFGWRDAAESHPYPRWIIIPTLVALMCRVCCAVVYNGRRHQQPTKRVPARLWRCGRHCMPTPQAFGSSCLMFTLIRHAVTPVLAGDPCTGQGAKTLEFRELTYCRSTRLMRLLHPTLMQCDSC